MVGVTELLAQARAAGLRVIVEEDRLTVHGPRRAEPIALRLLAEKGAVVQLLSATIPPRVCFVCRSRRFWRSIYGVTVCARCYPPATETLVDRWVETIEAARG